MLSSLNVFRRLASAVKPLAASAVLGAGSFGLLPFAIAGLLPSGGPGRVRLSGSPGQAAPKVGGIYRRGTAGKPILRPLRGGSPKTLTQSRQGTKVLGENLSGCGTKM